MMELDASARLESRDGRSAMLEGLVAGLTRYFTRQRQPKMAAHALRQRWTRLMPDGQRPQ